MEVPKKKIIRIKTKEEVLLLQRQPPEQRQVAPMFLAEGSVDKPSKSVEKPVIKPCETPVACSKEQEFLNTLDEKELIAYHIAKSHLGLLFSLDRSNCYLEWLNKK